MRMVLSALDTYAATLFLVVSLSIFGRKLYLRIRYLFLAKGQERRWDHVPTRLKNFIVYGIFQRKVAREWYAGVLHSFIFWAFVILGASVVEITAQAYASGWQVPTPSIAGFSLNGPLYLAEEVIAVLGAIGVGMALYRRYVIRPKKLMHQGMLDATIVLLFILGIVTSLLFYNAADIALACAALPAWKPISSTLARLSIMPAEPDANHHEHARHAGRARRRHSGGEGRRPTGHVRDGPLQGGNLGVYDLLRLRVRVPRDERARPEDHRDAPAHGPHARRDAA